MYDALDERGERELELASTLAARYQVISGGLKRGGPALCFPAPPPPAAADSAQVPGADAQAASVPPAVSSSQVWNEVLVNERL